MLLDANFSGIFFDSFAHSVLHHRLLDPLFTHNAKWTLKYNIKRTCYFLLTDIHCRHRLTYIRVKKEENRVFLKSVLNNNHVNQVPTCYVKIKRITPIFLSKNPENIVKPEFLLTHASWKMWFNKFLNRVCITNLCT